MKELVYLKNVVTLNVDRDKCNGCGMCKKVCPRGVLNIVGGKVTIVKRDNCMECGACSLNCAQMAISVLSGLGCGCATGIIEGYFNKNKKDCSCS